MDNIIILSIQKSGMRCTRRNANSAPDRYDKKRVNSSTSKAKPSPYVPSASMFLVELQAPIFTVIEEHEKGIVSRCNVCFLNKTTLGDSSTVRQLAYGTIQREAHGLSLVWIDFMRAFFSSLSMSRMTMGGETSLLQLQRIHPLKDQDWICSCVSSSDF
jgi:hypothetical protein